MQVTGLEEPRTYLTFTLEEEDFAVDVLNVREVLDYTRVTKVPGTPYFMRGVINLRGSVVPVVDLRLKFGLPETEDTADTCIVVLEIILEGEVTVIGAVADSVREVFEMTPDQIEPAPRIGTRLRTDFIQGMGKNGEQFIIILDIDRIFSSEELSLVHEAGDGSPLEDGSQVQYRDTGDGLEAAAVPEEPEDGSPGQGEETGERSSHQK